MSDGDKQDEKISSLTDLDNEAKKAADAVKSASAQNAIWDGALKALKPGLAELEKVRKDVQKELDQAKSLVKKLQDNYDSNVSESVRTVRTNVDGDIAPLKNAVAETEEKLNDSRKAADLTQKALDESTAQFNKSQKDLLGLPKRIQERQKALVALQTELNDADSKNQLVEAVVKLADLKDKITELSILDSSSDSSKDPSKDLLLDETKLWEALSNDTNTLRANTVANLLAQADVSKRENAYNEAKAKYEEAQKTRLDLIKKNAADVKPKAQSNGKS